MFSKAEKKYYVDIFMFMMGFACIITGFLLKFRSVSAPGANTWVLHEWTGYLVTAFIIIHLVMHSAWIKAATKNLLAKKKAVAGLAVSVFLPVVICGAIIAFMPNQQNGYGMQGGQGFGMPNGQGSGGGSQGYGYDQNGNGGGMNSGDGYGGNSYHGYGGGGYQGDGSYQGSDNYGSNQDGGITSETFQNWYYNSTDDLQSSQESAGIEM